MYIANQRQKKINVWIYIKYIFIVFILFVVLALIIWYIFIRNNDSSSSNFSKVGVEVAEVKPETKVITNELFKMTFPTTWELNGKKNPYSNQVYYEYQNKLKNYDNRMLKVYVDVFPSDFPINKLLPISVINNKIIPNELSEDCHTFNGAPMALNDGQVKASTWHAKWQGVSFICDMQSLQQNNVGTASLEEGYGVTIANKNGNKHKYFFVYIDHNVRPEYSIMKNAIESFEAL